MSSFRKVAGHRFVVLIAFLAFPIVPAITQEAEPRHSQFFIAPLAEVIGYSRKGPAIGGGLAVGAGDGVAIGVRCLYAVALGGESLNTLELAVFMRWYLRGSEAYTGPFVQLNAGAVMVATESAVSFPAEVGGLSLGIAFGWRFPLGKHWYIEPAVRAGIPYIAGAGMSAAFHF